MRILKTIFILSIVLSFFILFNCTTPVKTDSSSPQSNSTFNPGTVSSSIASTTLTNTITSIGVAGGTTTLLGRTVNLSSFYIGKYLVTYPQWYEVYQWAISNGYSFPSTSIGAQGSIGTQGAAPTDTEPATKVSWRSAIIWCNALSEKEGLTPVYCTDAGFTTPLRTVNASSTVTTTPGSEDNPYINWSSSGGFAANGYRLPSEADMSMRRVIQTGQTGRRQHIYQEPQQIIQAKQPATQLLFMDYIQATAEIHGH